VWRGVVEAIRAREDTLGLVVLPKPPDRRFKAGDPVKVIKGPFTGALALYAGQSNCARVRVLARTAITGQATEPGTIAMESPAPSWSVFDRPMCTRSNAFFASHGLASLTPANPYNPPSRRIRTRTSGGVGGAKS
jgi:hypothetical protein